MLLGGHLWTPKFLPGLLKLDYFFGSHLSLHSFISRDFVINDVVCLDRTYPVPIIFNGSEMDKNCLLDVISELARGQYPSKKSKIVPGCI